MIVVQEHKGKGSSKLYFNKYKQIFKKLYSIFLDYNASWDFFSLKPLNATTYPLPYFYFLFRSRETQVNSYLLDRNKCYVYWYVCF